MQTLEGRTAVLTLRSLADRLDALARRAHDLDDRGTGETDRDITIELSCLMGIADSSAFSCWNDYADQDGMERLRHAATRASEAWTYLRSGAPEIQRKLATPSPDDMSFILQRYMIRERATSPYCRTQLAPDCAGDAREQLRHLTIPGRPSMTLHTVLYRCANLSHARRVLKAIGLPFTQPDPESLRVGEELIYVQKPV